MEQDSAQIELHPLETLHCPTKNPALLLCTSAVCQHPSLTCLIPSCPTCLSYIHKSCTLVQLPSLLISLNAKLSPSLPVELQKALNEIDQIYLRMMDKISELREQLMITRRYYGFSQGERLFLQKLDEGKFTEITGRVVKEVFDQANRSFLGKIRKQEVKAYWQQEVLDIFNLCCQKIASFSKIGHPLRSTIVPHAKELTIRKFLCQTSKLAVDRFELLYRASERNYSALEFHKKCDNIPDTLVIAQTEFGCIIGGYTPLSWVASSSGEYRTDRQNKTFIFSLDNEQKYELIRSNNAIYCRNDYGPTFGAGYDIHISNMANSTNYSFCDFPHSFNRVKEAYKNNQEVYTKFSGATLGYNLKIRNWEVFKVIWETQIAQEQQKKKAEEQMANSHNAQDMEKEEKDQITQPQINEQTPAKQKQDATQKIIQDTVQNTPEKPLDQEAQNPVDLP